MKHFISTTIPLLVLPLAQLCVAAPGDAASELERLRAPYSKNMAAIAAYRDSRIEPINRAYTLSLERLEKESVARGETAVAEAARAERERVAAKEELTAMEPANLPPALAALRTRYEKDLAPLTAQVQQQERQQARQYLTALEVLQRRFTAANEFEKAAQVTQERSAISGLLPGRTTTAGGKTPGTSGVLLKGKLVAELADKIAEAVKAKSYVRSEKSGDDGDQEGGADIPEAGALLVGFEVMEQPSDKGAWIPALRPYFLTREGIVAGKDRSTLKKVSAKVIAREGYAVAGLLMNGGRQGFQVIFMKIDPPRARYDTSAPATYTSKWFGSKTRTPKQIGGDGRLVIGVYGEIGGDFDNIGLVQLTE